MHTDYRYIRTALMLCSLLEGEFQGFLSRSVSAMGCFFSCLRIRDDHRHPQTHLVSEQFPSKPREPVLSRNHLSYLLLAEGKENPVEGISQDEDDDGELKDEARFLKAYGTLLENPAEFQKTAESSKNLPPSDEGSEPSEFHSWPPNTSIEKLDLEKQPNQFPTPIKHCGVCVKGLGTLEPTSRSYLSNGPPNNGTISNSSTQGSGVGTVTNQASSSIITSVTAKTLAANVLCRNKSVHFEREDDATSFLSRSTLSEIAVQNSKQPESAGNYSGSKPSPYSTPLKLNDDMQTPGTVFPAYPESMEIAKNPRIRFQYVYPVLNPVENYSEWKVLKEEDSNSSLLSGHRRESLEQAGNIAPESEVGMRETSVENMLKVETSLSSWLKPPPTNQDANSQHSGSISIGKVRLGRTPVDRPIIGMVAAHWNEEKPSRVSPKYWDGNGIPNSTNKYKEDQKVCWHATPFEKRLEKVLSDETSLTQRKHTNGTPAADFDETEENETASYPVRNHHHPQPISSRWSHFDKMYV